MAKHSKKKITMCINNFEKGGAEKQFLYIYEYLTKFYDVNIILIDNKGVRNLETKLKKNIKVGLINFFIFLIKYRPNVVLFFLPKTYIIFGSISLFFPNIKRIMFRRSLNYYQTNFLIKYYEIFLHKFTDIIFSNSFAAKKELIINERVPSDKIFILKNFIDNKKYPLSKDLKINKKYINFLCIANFINYKGHKLILETFKFLKNKNHCRIYFFGTEKDFNFKSLKLIAKSYKFDQKIFHINKLSSELRYPNFKFGLLFSKNESFPNAILEYLKLNLDVIAYNTGDIKRFTKNECLIFDSRDPKKIAKKIEIYISKKRNKRKTKKINDIVSKYQNYNLFLVLKNKIDDLCVDY